MPKPFSPLALDKENVEKYGITPEIELSPLQKATYLQNQLHELRAMQWRARVDILHATRLSHSENEILRNKGLQNLSQHMNECEQATGAILMQLKFLEELRKEYPELQAED